MLIGAKASSSATTFAIAAVGSYDSVFAPTSSTDTAYEHNGAYFYFYDGYAMGFSSTSSIMLSTADISTGSDAQYRLSWQMDFSAGGYRAGATTQLLAHMDPQGQFARFYGDEYGKSGKQLERHNVSRIAGVLFGKGMDAEIHADTGDGLQYEMRP